MDLLSVAVANFTADVIWRQTERTRHLLGQHAIVDRLLALFTRRGPRATHDTDREEVIAIQDPRVN